ncbi:hypothetical protein M2651_12505 [Clostridium sp. SYSU_GA19001]|uniref:hypothetical protein n=1 Tax=Clostridium caldaquaticum TaxID=2940653 RepID=UPI00207790DB|nr:hypothetical protein [Clostridium caldaquaticum]MCM8711833.1 hypothetical protein [Clostridium caldaquaticum]
MKKKLALIWASYFIVAAIAMPISGYKKNAVSKTIESALYSQEQTTYIENTEKQIANNTLEQAQNIPSTASAEKSSVEKSSTVVETQNAENVKKSVSTSRGGSGLSKTSTVSSNTSSSESKSSSDNTNIEVLDWWKQAQYVFPKGATAIVQDVYTGKTFKVVRTMGTNHSDTEAATKADTEIIKSIWGGFSWNRRPVIVIIGERRLAASMSAMPHAGVDSAPAYAIVNNRSEGYGRGENLDVIKGNGMDGHFDIHFLNSTRHKDGQVDPQHQEMIKKAAK